MAKNVTRGFGLLERLLAVCRCNKADSLIPRTNRSGRILDIGCGFDPLFLRSIVFGEKYGLDKLHHEDTPDLSGRMIKFVNNDIEESPSLPFHDGYFNAVAMLAVIEHIKPENLRGIFKEIKRVLTPGGVFIATTPAAWTGGILSLMARIRLISPEEIDEHKSLLDLKSMSSKLEEAGFSQSGIRSGYFEMFMNTWIVAVK